MTRSAVFGRFSSVVMVSSYLRWAPVSTHGRPRANDLSSQRRKGGRVRRCSGKHLDHDQAGVARPARPALDNEPMEPSEVVRALWNRIQARDWTGVADLVAENAVIEWPVSSERIAGRANYVAVNREYPEGWSINVLRIVAEGDQVVSEVEVPHADLGAFRVVSYWTSPGADSIPAWRAHLVERY